ncbi:MAG: hypothetical protein HDS14_08340 [Bacteroides sp.]|nr:hypothetical protein [Bacteroides sp.]
MKTRLTVEESARLIKLGVDPKMASMCMLYFAEGDTSEPIPSWEVWKGCGKLLCNIFDEVENVECKIVPIDSDYDQSSKEETPIFTLADILSILPKEINDYHLNIEASEQGYEACYTLWDYEVEAYLFMGATESPELIDALNQLLMWCLEQKIIKQNKD